MIFGEFFLPNLAISSAMLSDFQIEVSSGELRLGQASQRWHRYWELVHHCSVTVGGRECCPSNREGEVQIRSE
jgi:hypothetical protein